MTVRNDGMHPADTSGCLVGQGGAAGAPRPDADTAETRAAREAMARVVERHGVTNLAVLAALRAVPRHLFMPPAFREGADAYGDHPCAIGYQQTISQPFIVAYMTDALRVQRGEKVLEIGTGSGYQAAVLAELGAEVYSVELLEPLAGHARQVLADQGYANVRVRHGDGYEGWAEHAPFDAIIVTCAPTKVPPALVAQLKDGGRMVAPVGVGVQRLVFLRKRGERLEQAEDLAVRFVPMVPGGASFEP